MTDPTRLPAPLTDVEAALVVYAQGEYERIVKAAAVRRDEALRVIARAHGIAGDFTLAPDGDGFSIAEKA